MHFLLSPQWTLLLGILLSFFAQKPVIQKWTKATSGPLLQFSVIALGATLNLKTVISQGGFGVIITFSSILFVFILGLAGISLLKIHRDQGILLTAGTAICGGSAIGALSPVIRASNIHIATSMSVVFLLNALAVFIFPSIGHFYNLTQEQFGVWAALSVHDTSSVVATTAVYGTQALEIGTFIKLIRALWIIPLVFIFSFYTKADANNKIKIPWFIFAFITMSLIFTFFDIPHEIKSLLSNISKLGFSATLFLIGLSLNLKQIKATGWPPLLLGIFLWIAVSLTTFIFVKTYF